MKRVFPLLCALAYASLVTARPLLMEQGEQLPFITGLVGLAGDDLLAVVQTSLSGSPTQYQFSANLYHRNGSGQWQLTRTLVTESTTEFSNRLSVSLNGSIAAVAMPSGLHIFERTSTGWAENAIDVTPRPLGQALDLNGTTILATEGGCATRALELNRAANGHWTLTATLPVASGTCVTALDLDTNAAIVRSQIDFEQAPSVRIFERGGSSGWTIAGTFAPLPDESVVAYFGQAVALHGDLALASGRDHGAYVYRRGASGWAAAGFSDNPDGTDQNTDSSIQITTDYVLRVASNFNRSATAGYLYRERPDHTFEHLATLVGTRELPPSIAIVDGQRVIELTGDFGTQPIEFNLPASFAVPALVQDDFESGATSQWTPLPGSQFAVVSNGTTHVYRQSSLAGNAGAVHSGDLTNQSIGADIRLNAVNGNDRWVGLMSRYTDEANFYYVTLRDTNRVVLKRILNGVFTELAAVPIDVAPGQTFHLNLESSGTLHAVDIDGQRVIRIYDAALAHGRTGLRMYKAAADFDNVVVSPGPVSNLVWADQATLGGSWTTTTANKFKQTSTSGNARRTTGLPREDQIVQSWIAVDSFATGGSPWVGLIARYQDVGNYYYVTARKSNELSLRKVTNGAVTELGAVPLAVTPHAPFVLRFEAIGDRLRVYVNDVLRIERSGAEVVAGKVGVMTYRAAASFDQYSAVEP